MHNSNGHKNCSGHEFKMPTIVGILEIISRTSYFNTDLSREIASLSFSMLIFKKDFKLHVLLPRANVHDIVLEVDFTINRLQNY